MKKIYLLVLITLCCISCTKSNYEPTIAIVDTSSVNKTSQITFYNENLEILSVKNYKYAELGTHFYQPQYIESKIYLVPKGLGNKHDEKKIVAYDKESKKISEIDINQYNIQCVSVDDKYVYASSNLNMISYLTQFDKDRKIYNEIKFENEYLSLIVAKNNKIYCFLTSLGSDELSSKISIYDDNLKLINTIDTTDIGNCQRKYVFINDIMYIPTSYDKNDNEISNILVFDTINNTIIDVLEVEATSVGDILVQGDTLIISHTNEVTLEGKGITIFNTKNKNIKSINLNISIKKMELSNSFLYVLDNNNNINVFDIKKNFKLIKKLKHKTPENMYSSTIFK